MSSNSKSLKYSANNLRISKSLMLRNLSLHSRKKALIGEL